MKSYTVDNEFSISNVPLELTAYPQWVCWKRRYSRKEGRWQKVPFDPKTGRQARVTGPKTWGTFSEATALLEKGGYDGIGYVFALDDPNCGIDLDDCLNPRTGEVRPAAWEVVALDSYAEVSPSGTGLKVWVRARKPGTRCSTRGTPGGGKIEV